MDCIEKINKIESALLDESSKILFRSKIESLITGNIDEFYNVIDTLANDWYCQELDDKLKEIEVKGIIVFGSGHDGKRTKKILENCNHAPTYFCDSDKSKVGCIVDGMEIISFNDLLNKYTDYLVVLASTKYMDEMYQMLLERGFPQNKILYPVYKILCAQCGRQYFDIWQAGEKEVFIDGGGYNGDSLLNFYSWTNGIYDKIHVFEPGVNMCQDIKQKINQKGIKNVELYQNALWNKEEMIHFLEADSGSRVEKHGKELIKGVALDEVVKDQRVTYIKMDVEGSELNALKGAKNTIIKNKPKLAICIYHRPEDILEIPMYILGLVSTYKFYIRHYSSLSWETVLYAEVQE